MKLKAPIFRGFLISKGAKLNDHKFLDRTSRLNLIIISFSAIILLASITLDLFSHPNVPWQYYSFAWGISAVLFLLGFIPPLFRMGVTNRAFKAQLWFGFIFILAVLVSCGVTFVRLNSSSTAPMIFMIAFVTVLTGILGWVIHAQLTNRVHRKTHTLNLLMQSRTSVEYQDHIRNINRAFPKSKKVTEKDIETYLDHQDQYITSKVDEETSIKAKGLSSIRYILNYYEFLAAGITKDDLDEDLLYECLSGIILAMHNMSVEFIETRKKKQKMVFKNLDTLVKYWKRREIEEG